MTHPHERIESAITAADVHLLLYTGIAVLAVACVASLAVPVLDAVRRRFAR